MRAYISASDINGEKVVFSANDSLWEMSLEDRVAHILASGLGVISSAKFSPNGKKVAFRVMAGEGGSLADIYIINSDGEDLKRLTYFNGNSTSRRMYTEVAGWKDNDHVIISTDSMSPFTALTLLYEVNISSGIFESLPLGPAAHIMYWGDNIFLGRDTWEMPHWKRYRGGRRGIIWKGKQGGTYSKFLDLETHVSSPAIINQRMFFITDLDGFGQIYSVSFDGDDLRKHTDFSDYYPRYLSSDGERAVFSKGGNLFLFKPENNLIEDITPHLNTGFTTLMEKNVDPAKYLEEFIPGTTGEIILTVVRGKGYISGIDQGPFLKIPEEFGRVRLLHLLKPDTVVFAADRGNEESVFSYNFKSKESSVLMEGSGSIESIEPSPDGRWLAVTNNRFQLLLLDLHYKKETLIESSPQGRIYDVAWASDSSKVAYVYPEIRQFLGGHEFSTVRIYDLKDGKVRKVTTDNSRDYSPSFSSDGNFLFYLSDRSLDPLPDRLVFDLGFQMITKPYYVPLGKLESPDEKQIPDELLPVHYTEERSGEEKLASRPFSINPGDISTLRTVTGGIAFLRYPVEGAMKYYNTALTKLGTLCLYSFATREESVVMDKVADFRVTGNGSAMIVRLEGNRLKKIEFNPASESKAFKINREIEFDLSRLSVTVDPASELKQMFNESWRMARDNFWNQSLSQEIADGIYLKYSDLLKIISSRYELSMVIREMQGEFGTSHSYEMGGDITGIKVPPMAKLGVDLVFRDGRFIISKIPMGDPSNENEKSPLAYGGFAEVGDSILSINGQELNESAPPWKLLVNSVNTMVNVELAKKDGRRVARPVKFQMDDRYLRYRDWVEANRNRVHRLSGGRLGYVHIPDMGINGFNEFSRLFGRESNYEGLIVDIRYNGGGSVSQVILEKLMRIRLGYDQPRYGVPHPYPADSVNGPLVAITNENAGSDGDIFSHAFKLLGLGPLVGTRTWGGVVGINPRRKLVDGTTVTQPEFALWFKDVKFSLENKGAEPTDEVEYPPHAYASNTDPQLEYAVNKCMRLLKNSGRRVDFVP